MTPELPVCVLAAIDACAAAPPPQTARCRQAAASHTSAAATAAQPSKHVLPWSGATAAAMFPQQQVRTWVIERQFLRINKSTSQIQSYTRGRCRALQHGGSSSRCTHLQLVQVESQGAAAACLQALWAANDPACMLNWQCQGHRRATTAAALQTLGGPRCFLCKISGSSRSSSRGS